MLVNMHIDHSRSPSFGTGYLGLWTSLDHMDILYGTVLWAAPAQPTFSWWAME